MQVPKIVKMVLRQLSKYAVVNTHDCGTSRTVIDEAYLAKIVSRLYHILLYGLLHVVADGDFTFASGNEAEWPVHGTAAVQGWGGEGALEGQRHHA